MAYSIYLFLALLSLIWGGSFFFIKVLLGAFGPFTITFLRCTMGAIVLMLVLLVRRERIEWRKLPWLQLVLVGIFTSAVPWTAIGFSEQRLPSTIVSVLNAFTPICTLLMGVLCFRAATSLNQWIGVTLGFGGIVVLLDIDWQTLSFGEPLGYVLMLVTTLSYGWSPHMSKKYFQGISAVTVSLFTLLTGAIVCGIMALSTETIEWSLLSEPTVATSIAALGALGSGIAFILNNTLIQRGSPQIASLVTYLIPPFAIYWGWLLLNEEISYTLFIGLTLILSGVFFATRQLKKPAAVGNTDTTTVST